MGIEIGRRARPPFRKAPPPFPRKGGEIGGGGEEGRSDCWNFPTLPLQLDPAAALQIRAKVKRRRTNRD